MRFSQLNQIHTLLTTIYVLKLNCIFMGHVWFTVELLKTYNTILKRFRVAFLFLLTWPGLNATLTQLPVSVSG